MKSEAPRPEVVARRLAALRQLTSSATEAPVADPSSEDRPDRDVSPMAVARRLDELRALCALADHLRLARRAPDAGSVEVDAHRRPCSRPRNR